jgi:hypothetical protein
LKSTELTLARAFISLADRIESELHSRGHFFPQKPMPRTPEQLAHVESFDSATRSSIERICERQNELRQRLTEVWESEMRPQYFTPASKLKSLRQRSIDLAKEGRLVELSDAIIAANDEEEREAAIAQSQFQRDYDASYARLSRKGKLEIHGI